MPEDYIRRFVEMAGPQIQRAPGQPNDLDMRQIASVRANQIALLLAGRLNKIDFSISRKAEVHLLARLQTLCPDAFGFGLDLIAATEPVAIDTDSHRLIRTPLELDVADVVVYHSEPLSIDVQV